MKISIINGDGKLTYTDTVESASGTSSSTSSTGSAGSSSSSTSSADTTSFSSTLNRVYVADNLSSIKSYNDIFKEAAETYGVDYNLLVAMAKQESGFDANATSSSGAMGIMQLMPATAEELGVENPYDAYENIMGGAKYIAQKLEEQGGNVGLALAAYNAGSGAVAAAGGIPEYEETQNYVINITSMMTRGVEVPAINYVPEASTKEALTADLEKLLAEFSEHDSYDEFINQLNTTLEAASSELTDTTDAKTAYEALLSNTNATIKNMLENNG